MKIEFCRELRYASFELLSTPFPHLCEKNWWEPIMLANNLWFALFVGGFSPSPPNEEKGLYNFLLLSNIKVYYLKKKSFSIVQWCCEVRCRLTIMGNPNNQSFFFNLISVFQYLQDYPTSFFNTVRKIN